VLVSCTIPPHGSAVIDHIDPDVRESVMADSGHLAMIGRPAELAAILNEVAARAR
jgi:hypothetical protein